jgi:hypothetical protein
LHPRVQTDLREQVALDELKAELLVFLGEMQDAYSMTLHDLSDVTTYGGDVANFWDGAHIDSVNADKLLEYLLVTKARDDE